MQQTPASPGSPDQGWRQFVSVCASDAGWQLVHLRQQKLCSSQLEYRCNCEKLPHHFLATPETTLQLAHQCCSRLDLARQRFWFAEVPLQEIVQVIQLRKATGEWRRQLRMQPGGPWEYACTSSHGGHDHEARWRCFDHQRSTNWRSRMGNGQPSTEPCKYAIINFSSEIPCAGKYKHPLYVSLHCKSVARWSNPFGRKQHPPILHCQWPLPYWVVRVVAFSPPYLGVK